MHSHQTHADADSLSDFDFSLTVDTSSGSHRKLNTSSEVHRKPIPSTHSPRDNKGPCERKYGTDGQNALCPVKKIMRVHLNATDNKVHAPKKRKPPTPRDYVPSLGWTALPTSKRSAPTSKRRAACKPWTAKEDQRLRDVVQQLGGACNWDRVSQIIETRSAGQCAQRWRKNLRPELANIKRGKWDVVEDLKLHGLVSHHIRKFGKLTHSMWERIACGMDWRRSPKQCRDRWRHFLDPSIKIGNWTQAEDAKLMCLYAQYGPSRWCKLAQQLPGRTPARVKRRLQVIRKRQEGTARPKL